MSEMNILIHKNKINSFLEVKFATLRTWKEKMIFKTYLFKATLDILIAIKLTTTLLTQ